MKTPIVDIWGKMWRWGKIILYKSEWVSGGLVHLNRKVLKLGEKENMYGGNWSKRSFNI